MPFILIIIQIIKVIVIFACLMTAIAYTTYFERRLLAFIQSRLGPNRVGPAGLFQPIADAVKLLFKEEYFPDKANKILFSIAPLLSFFTACMAIAVIPVGNSVTIAGYKIDLVISDLNIGILYIFALSSLAVYGVVLAGWSSNSKYSLLGGLRGSAQMISYEIGLGLSVVGLLMLSGTFSLTKIVSQQSDSIFHWYIFKQPVAFFIFFISAMADTNRLPFDMPEAESELVAGYHTEYSGMRFGLFYLAEYCNMITVSALASTLFFGGWAGPVLPPVVWFLLKTVFFLFIYVWVRGTLPRFRYDQLMRFGWLVLIPLALANILITGLVMQL
jgi:NADH-quinone oxidoreductase subunit H